MRAASVTIMLLTFPALWPKLPTLDGRKEETIWTIWTAGKARPGHAETDA
jgi:hypothetical protein